jgi:hypothetical protein
MTMARRPSRRFQRSQTSDDSTANIRLTEDDINILLHVYRHRLLDSECIYSLLPGRSQQQISRRLNLLFRHHYLGRPPRQVELFPAGDGSHHLVYGIDREGARVLKERFGLKVSTYHWLQKNRELTRTNIAHTSATSRFLTRLEVAVQRSGKARILHLDEILRDYAPEATKRKPIPERWQVDIHWNGYRGREGTRPDRIIGIEYADLPKEKNRSFFYVELDEGNETIEPTIDQRRLASFFRKSSILRKFLVYSFSHLSRAHEAHFGLPIAARVLVVTTTRKRIDAMRQCFMRHFRKQPLVAPPGLFLFAERTACEASDDLFAMPWIDAEGKPRHIDDR